MIDVAEEKSLYQSHFQELKKNLKGEPEWLTSIRREALGRFLTVGFPSSGDEEWRLTNVAPIVRTPFRLSVAPLDHVSATKAYQEGSYQGLKSPQFVFVNGWFAPELSSTNRIPRGLSMESLGSVLKTDPQWLKSYLSRYAGYDEHAFVALNTAFFQDVAIVRIGKDTVVEEPIHLLYLSIGDRMPMVCYPRTLIVAETNSQVRILESYSGTGEVPCLTNAVTEVVLEQNAIVDHYKVQRESLSAFHVATLQIHQSRSSNFSSQSISLGGRLVRNDVNAVLDGEGSESVLNGLYVAKGQQHMDNHTRIDHAKPHCNSRELYKGILDDKARGVFNGRIIVRQGAQKTDSKQTNKNLLLSEEALANTNPQLEIYADDVKCTHGATVGQLSAEVIFYLRTRGIGLEAARHLLTYAFGSEITGRIKIDPVREELEKTLFSQLPLNHGNHGKPMSAVTENLATWAACRSESSYDVYRIRESFPALNQMIRGKPLVYLDNAATSQKPRPVIDAVTRFYSQENSNVHRGVHYLSEMATREFERARVKVQKFLNASEDREIIFVRGTTEAINLVAATLGRQRLQPGDEVLISGMEHHSNIVPWQILCAERGARLQVAPINDRGELLLEEFSRLLTPRTKLVAVAHVSNALGTINPIKQMVELAHQKGAPVLVDGAQAVPHSRVDVQELDCDFYAFSGHKVYGPTGIGVLYGKAQLLEEMPPYQGGGDMISSVTFEATTYNQIPYKFEAGTPDIAGVLGLGAALDYLASVGMERIAAHEQEILGYATQAISAIPKVRLVGTAQKKASVLSFVLEGVHAHDVGTILDQEGVAIRAGHHCAQPVMDRFGLPATVRASFGLYNTREEVDTLSAALQKVSEVFG